MAAPPKPPPHAIAPSPEPPPSPARFRTTPGNVLLAPVVLDRIADRRADCWRWMDEQVEPRRFILGDELGALDIYVATVSRWSPRRKRFYSEAPKMAEVVRRVDADPRLAEFWEARAFFFVKIGKARRCLSAGYHHVPPTANSPFFKTAGHPWRARRARLSGRWCTCSRSRWCRSPPRSWRAMSRSRPPSGSMRRTRYCLRWSPFA
jgi:hypothetical protein